MPHTYVALDLEFTGLDRQHDEIIEIGMVMFRGQQILDTFTSLVGTRRPLPHRIQQLSGISQADVDQAPSFHSLKGNVLGFVKSYPLVGHTIEMDLHFLGRQGLPLHNLAIDTFELASILLPEARTYSLSNLASHLDIELPQGHRALPDALATKDLFLALVDDLQEWDQTTLEELVRLSQGSGWSLTPLLQEILAERRDGSPISLSSGQVRQARRHGLASQKEPESPPLEPTPKIIPLDARSLSAMISPGGILERSFPGYEHRPQQVEMLEAVAEAFNTPAHLLVEAGTGVGKSLAYLLPAIHFALQNGRRVVVSSGTINLQDQLHGKDVPDLQSILPQSFRAALLKGRNNYLCLRRLSAFRRSRQLSADQVRVLAKVLAWLPKTQSGDRSELLLIDSEPEVWAHLQATSETCMGDLCPFRQSGECFHYRARARAERAHLVIVNHALLLSDLLLANRILPDYQYLIVDEAHHLEEQATQQFGFEVGRQDIYAFLTGLSHTQANTPGGLLAEIPGLLQRPAASETQRQGIASLIENLRTEIEAAQRRAHELFSILAHFLRNHASASQAAPNSYDQLARLTPGLRAQPDWSTVEIAWESCSVPLRQILHDLERLCMQIEKMDLGESSQRDEVAQEIKAQMQRGNEIWLGLDAVLLEGEQNSIYWISSERRTEEITLHSAPLHVGQVLEENLFTQKECVVLTSATLRTGNSFRFIKERLSLEDPMELALDSPFDFETSVLLYVPKDIPEPNQPYYQKSVENALTELCRATEGRTLILFTSNSQLRATYRAIRDDLDQDGIVLFGQGIDGSRRQILRSFRSTPKSVLMGTRSFWEGIDVVGKALSCLVIARLPFAVPTNPVLAARSETFEDPFNEYYLPDAILRFRQGFGRLIRRKDDYGLVVVLDKRLLTKTYGSAFLRSLPRCTARQGPLETLPGLAKRWLDAAQNR